MSVAATRTPNRDDRGLGEAILPGPETNVETLTLKWHLGDIQVEFFETDARYRVLAGGRRFGKNIVANARQLDYALRPYEYPYGADDDPVCWWVGPTYDQAKKYGLWKAESFLPDELIDGTPKRSEPYQIDLNVETGGRIEYRTFDKPDSLDGAYVDDLVIDEAAKMPREIWDNTLRPMLVDHVGSVSFISKPVGTNYFQDFYTRGQSDDWPDWASWRATSYDNPFIPDAEIDAAAKGTPDRVFKQEYLAVFLEDAGGVFKKVRENNVESYDWESRNGNAPYTWGWDFARHQNWTVGICLDRDGLLVDFYRDQSIPWNRIGTEMRERHDRYPGVIRADATRDEKVIEDLMNDGYPVEPISWGGQGSTSKKTDIDNLAARMEAGEITIPDIPELVNELNLYEYEMTKARNVRYGPPTGWHDDCVDALALAARKGTGPRSATWGPGKGAAEDSRLPPTITTR